MDRVSKADDVSLNGRNVQWDDDGSITNELVADLVCPYSGPVAPRPPLSALRTMGT